MLQYAFQQGCLPLPPLLQKRLVQPTTSFAVETSARLTESIVNCCGSKHTRNNRDRHLVVSAAAAGKKTARSNNKTVIRMKACSQGVGLGLGLARTRHSARTAGEHSSPQSKQIASRQAQMTGAVPYCGGTSGLREEKNTAHSANTSRNGHIKDMGGRNHLNHQHWPLPFELPRSVVGATVVYRCRGYRETLIRGAPACVLARNKSVDAWHQAPPLE